MLAILLLTSALRIYGLADESLWLDEALVDVRISKDYQSLLTDWDSKRQGPLYPIIAKAWCDQFGDDEFNLRFTAALLGILAVFAIYRLGKELFGYSAGIWAALLSALNPFLVYFSQEARPYTLFILCSTFSVLYFVRILRGASIQDNILFVLSTIGALYSHPYGPFLIVTHFLMVIGLLWSERESLRVALRRIWISMLSVLLLYTPMLYIFTQTFLQKIEKPTVAGSWLVHRPIIQVWETICDYFMNPVFGIALCAFIIAVIGMKLWRDKKFGFPLTVLLSLALSFLLVPWIISALITPIYLYKYTAPAIVVFLILAGYALSLIPWKPRIAALVVLIALNLWPLYENYTRVDKDPWRQTVAYLNANLQAHDMILLDPTYASSPFRYYYQDRKDVLYRRLRFLAEFREVPGHIQRVWFVFAHFHTPLAGEDVYNKLTEWGNPEDTIHMTETLPMNPDRYFASEIDITRFDRK